MPSGHGHRPDQDDGTADGVAGWAMRQAEHQGEQVELAEARASLVRILQDAHAGELAAAYAYRGHWRSRRDAGERAEIQRIEAAEWHHRYLVAGLLRTLGEAPRPGRERLMGLIGRVFGALCSVSLRFAPMYAAGRLEAMNVGQYADARDHSRHLGLDDFADALEEMRLEELRHEDWFADQVRGHRLLPFAALVGGWSPRDPPPGERQTGARDTESGSPTPPVQGAPGSGV